MNRSLPLSFAVALALASSTVNALGLGAISVKSDLNEPLRAEIPVFVNNADEAFNLQARLAAAEEFARVGLNISGLGVPIRFEVIRNARGEPMIAVTSDQPVREPFLSFLVEVNWANGRLLREYSVLLDPPVSAPAIAGSLAAVEKIAEPEMLPVEPLSDEPVILEPRSGTENIPEPVAESEQSSAPLQPETVETANLPEAEQGLPTQVPEREQIPEPVRESEPAIDESTFTSDYGPVVSGETLWEIATTTRSDEDISLNQMMLALLRANPAAFYQDNVNALKRGAILRIPGKEEIKTTAVAQAAVEILHQNRRWIEATRPTLVADSSASGFAPGNSSDTGSNNNASRLELVPPAADGNSSDRPGMAAGTGDSAVRAEVARTKEALISSQSEVSELRSRVKELEDVSQKSEQLLQLKNSELKGLQDRLAEAEKRAKEATLQLNAARTQADLPPQPAAENNTALLLEDKPSTTASEEPGGAIPIVSLEETTQPAADLPAVAENATNQETATVSPTVETEAEKNVEVIPLPESAAAQSTPATAINPEISAPWYKNSLYLGGGALLLAGLSVLGLYSRRRKSSTSFAPQRNSIADEFSGGIGGVKTGNQKSASTETILLNEVTANPTDIIAHLNLVDYFYNAQDVEKFEAAAEAMHAQVSDFSSPEWQSVVLMGSIIAPENPLFNGQNEDETLSSSLGEEFDAKSFNSSVSSSASEDTSRFSGEFDMVSIDVFEPAASVWRDEQSSDATKNPEKAQNFTDSNLIKTAADDLQFDFDLDMDAIGTVDEAAQHNTPASRPPPVTSVFQPVKVVTADSLGDDAVATKIDLARAYLDMGDPDGARSMLEEVMTEGNPGQRAEAASLLAEMR